MTMNLTPALETSPQSPSRPWSNRILIAALVGIFFLTLYPFEFSLHTKLPLGASPFFLGKAGKSDGPLDIVLNVLLFMPFGFALGAQLRSRGMSWLAALLYIWSVGALVSYGIEFLQIYIPARDSGWEDVFTNSAGAAIGFLTFASFGSTSSNLLSKLERSIETWLTVPRAALMLLAYLAVWTLYSVQLQKQTHLENWNSDCFLVFGNDATGRHPWRGKLLRTEIWDRALADNLAKQLTSGNDASPDNAGALAKFDFSSIPARQDDARLIVPLSLPTAATSPKTSQASVDGVASIASTRPVSDLIDDLQRTNQFSIRLVFEPEDIADANGRIVAISQPSGLSDLYLRQEDANLVFWFRNRLSVERSTLAWTISNVLATGQTRDLLFSYDGSDLYFYVDGRKLQDRYLGPGTAFAGLFHRAKTGEVNGYKDIYYAAVFLPIGCLFGITARKISRRIEALIPFALSLLLGPLILEFALAQVSGRSLSFTNLILSAGMVVAGILWINSDRVPTRRENRGDYLRP